VTKEFCSAPSSVDHMCHNGPIGSLQGLLCSSLARSVRSAHLFPAREVEELKVATAVEQQALRAHVAVCHLTKGAQRNTHTQMGKQLPGLQCVG